MPSQWSFHAYLHPIISLHVTPCSIYAPNSVPCSALILNLRRRWKGKAAFRWAEVILVKSSDYICMAKVFHSTMAETLWCLLTVSIPDCAHHITLTQSKPSPNQQLRLIIEYFIFLLLVSFAVSVQNWISQFIFFFFFFSLCAKW